MPRESAVKTVNPNVETFVAKDATALKALADPMRLQILMELAEGQKTVKEVSAVLETGPTRLYYHFKILERAGLIRVAGRRMVSGIEERRYTVTAESWTSAPGAASPEEESDIIAAVLEVARAEIELAVRARGNVELGDVSSPVPSFVLTQLALSKDDAADVQKRFEKIMEDYGETGKPPKGKRIYHALLTTYITPSELRRQS